jgi:hypothetical protein
MEEVSSDAQPDAQHLLASRLLLYTERPHAACIALKIVGSLAYRPNKSRYYKVLSDPDYQALKW